PADANAPSTPPRGGSVQQLVSERRGAVVLIARGGESMVSVLIVDDDAHICRALTRALNAHGFESTAARGYDEAVERLADRHYDVLLTDLRMGEKDGIALLSKLR